MEVAGPEDEIELQAPSGVDVRWIYRGGRSDLVPEDNAGDHAPLIAAVKEALWLPGQVQVFIHGEAQAVMHNLRPYIRKERGSTPGGRPRSPGTGGAAAPRRRSASGSANWPPRNPDSKPIGARRSGVDGRLAA